MGLFFDRVIGKSKVTVISHHQRTGGTYIRFEALTILLPSKKEFRSLWANFHADWMNITKGEKKMSVVEVVLLMSEESFREKFPKASASAETHKLHEKFKNQHFQKPQASNTRFIRESNRAYGRGVYA